MDGDSLFSALAYAHADPRPGEEPPSGQDLRTLAAASFNENKHNFMADGTPFRDIVLRHYAAYGVPAGENVTPSRAADWAHERLSTNGYNGPIIAAIAPVIVGLLLGVHVQVMPTSTWEPQPYLTYTGGNGTIAHGTRTLSVVHNQHHKQWRPAYPEHR